jgi:transposase
MKKRIFIGIDVSKLTLDVSVLFPDDTRDLHQIFSNNTRGFKKLLSWLKKEEKGNTNYLFCFEDTGVYSIGLECFFTEHKIAYVAENPFRIKRSMGIQRGKDDKTDSMLLAKYVKRFADELKLSRVENKTILELKQLLSLRDRLMKDKGVHQRRLKEAEQLAESLSLIFLIKKEKEIIKYTINQIKEIESQLEEIMRGEEKLWKQNELLCSIPGVGKQIALNMLVYTEGFQKFENWRKFSCYAGLAPFKNQSGTSLRRKPKVSRIANKKLKGLLTMGALTSIKAGNEYRKYYDKKTGEGKHPMLVLNAIKNKMVSRMFSVIARQTPYVCLQQ